MQNGSDLGCGWAGGEQLLLRMHTAFFQAGSAVVESDQPADRICIVVSGRSIPNLSFCQSYPAVKRGREIIVANVFYRVSSHLHTLNLPSELLLTDLCS